MKGYFYLLIAILGEIVGTNFLKASQGFTKIGYSVFAIVIYIICFFALAKSMKYLPLNVAYALWGAVGIIILTLFSIFFWKEDVNIQTIIGIIFIVIGTILVNLFGTKH